MKTLTYFILIILLLAVNLQGIAQPIKKLKIIQADYLEGIENRQEKIKKLIGHVILEHEGALMHCDSAYHFENRNYFEAYNNVRIIQGSDFSLTGNFLHYNLENKIAEVDRNVVLSDKDMTLSTPHLTYNMENKTAYYTRGATIVDSANTLTSRYGTYYSSSKDMYFKLNVVLENPDFTLHADSLRYNTNTRIATFLGPTKINGEDTEIYCEAGWYNTNAKKAVFQINAYVFSKSRKIFGDRLFYDENTGDAHANGRVRILEENDNTEIAGNKSFHDEQKNTTWITDSALFIKYLDDDTLFMHSDTLKIIKNPETDDDVVLAYFKVKLFSSNFKLKCDSLSYQTLDSSFLIYEDPVLWFDSSQITGEFIQIFTRNQKLDKMDVKSSSFMIEMVDTSRFNQIKGRDLVAYFANNDLNTIFVEGNAESVYYLQDKNKKYMGRNNIQSSTIHIKMKDNKISEIQFNLEPEGIVHPAKSMDSNDPFLKGFIWRQSEKPEQLEDIFIRNISVLKE
ncbi:MAG: hypothetical protein ISR55_03420 [Bacteroidetes bacterium]|nr:hypothetical protein [Bacteroidota bacterium]